MAAQGIDAYALVHATVRALRPALLSSEVWTALIQAESYDAVLDTLVKTVYGPYLDIPGGRSRLTPRRLIYQIRWHLSDMYAKLIGLMPEPGRQLLVELWHHYEVDNIKAVLRGIETGATWEQVLFLLGSDGQVHDAHHYRSGKDGAQRRNGAGHRADAPHALL